MIKIHPSFCLNGEIMIKDLYYIQKSMFPYILSNYSICFDEKKFNKNYDFCLINKKLNYNVYKKYNFICYIGNKLLLSNKYAIYNNKIYKCKRLNDINTTSKILINNKYVFRYIDNKKYLHNILENISALNNCNCPKIYKIYKNLLIEEYIESSSFNDFDIFKFIFSLYLLFIKNIMIFDLSGDNIIISKDFKFYIVDLEDKNIFNKFELLIFYINIYIIDFFCSDISDKISKKYYDRLKRDD